MRLSCDIVVCTLFDQVLELVELGLYIKGGCNDISERNSNFI